MANPVITAAVIIEANGAALNNSGEPILHARTDNTVSVKAIRFAGKEYPYVSGQAWRRWWRETLYGDFGWAPSPVTREAKSAYTEGNPVAFADDDIFGYMAARKKATFRRVSPLKNSLLVSVLPNTIERDFAHFSRNLPVSNPDPVPFESEHYSTYLQGVFSLALQDVGTFEMGKVRDLPEDFTSPDITISEDTGSKIAKLSSGKRRERVVQCIEALARLRSGANLTRNLSDVTPVAVIIGFLDGGNAPFQRIFMATEDGDKVKVDVPRLTTVLSDYKDRMLEVDAPVVVGCIPGVLENEDEMKRLHGVHFAGSAVDAIRKACDIINNGDWLSSLWG